MSLNDDQQLMSKCASLIIDQQFSTIVDGQPRNVARADATAYVAREEKEGSVTFSISCLLAELQLQHIVVGNLQMMTAQHIYIDHACTERSTTPSTRTPRSAGCMATCRTSTLRIFGLSPPIDRSIDYSTTIRMDNENKSARHRSIWDQHAGPILSAIPCLFPCCKMLELNVK